MSNNPDDALRNREELTAALQANPGDWDARKELAHLLYNEGRTKEAADVVWEAPELPSIDLELGFAIKVLGKGRPRRAIRLLNEIQRRNQGKVAQNLGLANALLHHGMVMQAARFYGAAVELDPEVVNSDQEHFLLWVDDAEKLWGGFEDEGPKLEELPWIKRDAAQAEKLKKSMKGHTTPISIPGLKRALAEEVQNEMYVQSEHRGDKVSPPPAVTIPMDRVEPKHVVIDNERGAGQPLTAEEARAAKSGIGKSTGVRLPQAMVRAVSAQGDAAEDVELRPIMPASLSPTQPAAPVARAKPIPTSESGGQTTPTVKIQPAKTNLVADGKIRIPKRKS